MAFKLISERVCEIFYRNLRYKGNLNTNKYDFLLTFVTKTETIKNKSDVIKSNIRDILRIYLMRV